MPHNRVGAREWEWEPDGVAHFLYAGPVVPPSHTRKPWDGEAAPERPQRAPTVPLGDRAVTDLPAALAAAQAQPNVTGALRRLAREFGSVPVKEFIDAAEAAGINRHTATKQARLGRKGVE